MWISDFSIRRPVFAVMLVLALVALGFISLGRLGVDLFPRVEFPYIVVTSVLEGADPETMESEVSDILEENINTISGIESLRSINTAGVSRVLIEFGLNENVDVKAQDVRDRVSLAMADLPDDLNPPIIEKVDPDGAPIMSVMISGDLPIAELTRFADDVVKEALERLPGVGSVSLIGGREREIRIWLDANRLRSLGLTANDVVRAIRRENAQIPGGRLETGGATLEFGITTEGEVQSVQEFENLVVAFRENGGPTLLRDVARVVDGLEDERSYAELNGRLGVSLEVRRQSGRNTVEVARAVREAVATLTETAPTGMEMVIARDVSRFIESSARDVAKDMMVGIVLVVIVTLIFLMNFRATAIVAVAIPTSVISTFFAFYIFDFTINTLTLLALSVAVGLLVDDAIVVLESIQRQIDEGKPPLEAASAGIAKVGSAVLAGSISVLAVFIPIAFMEGIVGRFFLQYGLTIVFSVTVSLIVALTLTPMLCSRILSASSSNLAIFGGLERGYQKLEAGYKTLLGWAIGWRYAVLTLAVASVFGGGIFASAVPMGFTSKADRSEFLASIDLPLGTGISGSREVGNRVALALLENPEIEDIFFTVGGGAESRVDQISFYAALTPKQTRDTGQAVIMDQARQTMRAGAPTARDIVVAEVPWVSGGGLASSDIELVLQGPDLVVLEDLSFQIMDQMRGERDFVDIRSSYEFGRPEVQVDIQRQRAADLGVPVTELASVVRTLFGGVVATTFEETGSRFDVRVQLEPEQRTGINDFRRAQVRSDRGMLIDLENVANISVGSAAARIERQNRTRKISVSANTSPGVALGTATETLEGILEEVEFPTGYTIRFEGMARRMKESASAIGFAFLLALIALYMILASQFNSFSQPVLIMLTAPLSFVGAFAAIYFAGLEMSLFAQIGLIALMGLVMKNGILLIDLANQNRMTGMAPRDAMKNAGPERLRPVLMTALSTIFGMIPVALSTSDGAEWRNAMGFLVIGGLTSSTFLTLLVIPAAYTVAGDISWFFRAVWKRMVGFVGATRLSK